MQETKRVTILNRCHVHWALRGTWKQYKALLLMSHAKKKRSLESEMVRKTINNMRQDCKYIKQNHMQYFV